MRRTDPSALAWLVGNELRQARERIGETQASAAGVIGCSTSRMNYLESGRTVQQPDDVRALMHLYGEVAGGERLAALVETPGRRAWWLPWKPVIPEPARLFVGLEGLAEAEFCYLPLVVPELLQTARYTAALVALGSQSPVAQDRMVHLRQARQQRLTSTDDAPLRAEAIIEQDALSRPVGGPEVLREQLEQLLELGERANVTVRVMPRTVAVHPGLDGAFTVLDFAAAQSVVYLGAAEHGHYLAEQHTVADYRYRAQRLRTAALPPDRSSVLISQTLARSG